jgi:carboxyl-terminal processing protease
MLNDSWTLDLFLANFDKNNSVFESYLSKISDISSLSIDTKEKINSYVKATIAREIFGDEGFYRSIQKDDAMLQKVLELDSSTE